MLHGIVGVGLDGETNRALTASVKKSSTQPARQAKAPAPHCSGASACRRRAATIDQMPRLTRAAIGFRVHSGWAAVVAVAGSPLSPVVLDRRRIEIADRSIHGSVQPYHAAKELGMSKAESFLKRCSESSQALAQRA